MNLTKDKVIKRHPCLSEDNSSKFGRIHLAVAPRCNIQCAYCQRKYDCPNESKPGITSKVLRPEEALQRVSLMLERHQRITVIGIAGPGDPLANEETFETLYSISRNYPDISLCLSTNGLLLSERLVDIIQCGVRSVTITINSFTEETASRFYDWATFRGKIFRGIKAAELVLYQQWRGLRNAVDAGLIVKINTVYCPKLNEHEIPRIAKRAGEIGAEVMNIMPLIPQARLSGFARPDHSMLTLIRKRCEPHIRQMTHCKQCRADSCGSIGQDIDMELEALYDRLQEDYCDMVN